MSAGAPHSNEYWQRLYAVQDAAAAVLRTVQHEFCLTGDTALTRGYYVYRYSVGLDYFASDRDEFEVWRERCIAALQRAPEGGWVAEVLRRDTRFGRVVLHADIDLKIEFVNDVPCRCGTPVPHAQFGLIDSLENILSNKITALVDRAAPKDVADIFWLCCRAGLSLPAAMEGAHGKAAGIFPPLVAKRLHEARGRGVPEVLWLPEARPSAEEFSAGLEQLIATLIE